MTDDNTQPQQPASGEDTVEVSRSELQQIIEQNKELMEQNRKLIGASEEDPNHPERKRRRKSDESYVRVSFLNGKPVVGFANVGTENSPRKTWTETDPNDKNTEILKAKLYVKDTEEPIEVDFNEFLREGEHRWSRVAERRDKKDTEEQGYVMKKEVDDTRTIEQGYEVPVVIEKVYTSLVVELPDTQEQVTLPNEMVNMA